MKSLLLMIGLVTGGLCFGATSEETIRIERFILGSWQSADTKTPSAWWLEFRDDGIVYLYRERGSFERGSWKKIEGRDDQVVVVFETWKVAAFRRAEDLIFSDSAGEKAYVRRRRLM
jgi:hypothetical protein